MIRKKFSAKAIRSAKKQKQHIWKNPFVKPKLFERKDGIGAERFCEIYRDFEEKKSYLVNAAVVAEVKSNNKKIDGRFFRINLSDFIPPRCKIADPFDIIYDKEKNVLYAVAYDGICFRMIIDNTPVTIHTSDMVSCARTFLVGKTELIVAKTFTE